MKLLNKQNGYLLGQFFDHTFLSMFSQFLRLEHGSKNA